MFLFDLLGDGFNQKCYDGVSFFSNKHPMGGKDKAVQSNMGNKKLNAESYSSAMSFTGIFVVNSKVLFLIT